MFPIELLDVVVHRIAGQLPLLIDQAGIARQSFEAVEAFVMLSLEDAAGNLTHTRLIGFAGVLDRAVLHFDMPQLDGWLEIDA